MAFSKLIHLVWFQGFTEAPERVKVTPALWRAMNPGYTVMEWDASSLTAFIAKHYRQYLERWSRLDRIIKQCDMARFLLVHHFGGAYVDADLLPQRPLDEFLDGGEVRHLKTKFVARLPQPDPVAAVNLREREFILSREYRDIDQTGSGVANGVIIAQPKLPMWIDFVEQQVVQPHRRVLDFFGPHALTRFLRERADEVKGKGLVLPPYYFLWEEHAMKQDAPSWVVSKHPAINHWGDASRSDWWNV